MADEIFENPDLVEIYDFFDGQRDDLDHYDKIAQEFKANSILDIGAGTGCFACLMSQKGFKVIALEPAKASLDKAQLKEHADTVHWILGDTKALPETKVNMAFMTGNVAQVFLKDDEWEDNLKAIKNALDPSGYLVFEIRDPEQKAWLDWTTEKTRLQKDIPRVGRVESWCEVTEVRDELVSFVWRYKFHANNNIITSKSTLRFRTKENIIKSLEKTGFSIKDIRDAPDRPQKEFVFIAEAHA